MQMQGSEEHGQNDSNGNTISVEKSTRGSEDLPTVSSTEEQESEELKVNDEAALLVQLQECEVDLSDDLPSTIDGESENGMRWRVLVGMQQDLRLVGKDRFWHWAPARQVLERMIQFPGAFEPLHPRMEGMMEAANVKHDSKLHSDVHAVSEALKEAADAEVFEKLEGMHGHTDEERDDVVRRYRISQTF